MSGLLEGRIAVITGGRLCDRLYFDSPVNYRCTVKKTLSVFRVMH
jgi:hypothetical protein